MTQLQIPSEESVPFVGARRRGLIARLLLVFGVCLGAGWAWHSAHSTSNLREEIARFPDCEFNLAQQSLTCRQLEMSDRLAGRIASAQTIGALELSGCRLSGKGLSAITSLPSLYQFSLVDCEITGNEKVELGATQWLGDLVVRRTRLAKAGFANFLGRQRQLQSLVLDNTGITDDDLKEWPGLPDIGRVEIREPGVKGAGLIGLRRCQSLDQLSLSSSGIDDQGLAVVARASSLKNLELTHCASLNGSGLHHPAQLTKLRTLDLSGTPVTNEGLQCLGRGFPDLHELRLRDCREITDAAFQSLGLLPGLIKLDLSGTNVTGYGLKFLNGHKTLNVLNLSGTRLNDGGLSKLGTMPALTTLDLSKTRVGGRQFSVLKNCHKLRQLSIAGCSVSREGFQNLRDATSLQSLDCSGCATVNDETIEALQGMKNLQTVDCRDTQVFDSWEWNLRRDYSFKVIRDSEPKSVLKNVAIDEALALELGARKKMRDLTLDHCRLSANALKSATSSSALRSLTLTGCTIVENKPARLGNLERIESLRIQNTRMDESDIGRVVSGRRIRHISLDGTGLTDAAFSRWTGVPSMRSIELKEPQLTGTGLTGLRQCPELQRLDLTNSGVTGAMLENVQHLMKLQSIVLAGCQHVTDRGLVCLKDLPRLTSVDLSGTGVTDSGVELLSGAHELGELNLSTTSIDGHGLTFFKDHKSLSKLDLSGTKLTDESIARVTFPPFCSTLSVAKTAIRGTGLAGCNSLCDLDASDSNIDGDGIKTIQTIKNIWSLNLSHCRRVSDADIQRIATMPRLARLNLEGTGISDAALGAIATMAQLTQLNLKGTQVTVEGVRRLSSCPRLNSLEIDKTRIPESIVREVTQQRRIVSKL